MQISSLGPKRPHKIPLQVHDEDSPAAENKTSEVGKVLQSWKSDFQGLYSIPGEETSMFDNEFYNQIKSELTNIKELELHNASIYCANYNLPLSWAEFDKVCNGLNLRIWYDSKWGIETKRFKSIITTLAK